MATHSSTALYSGENEYRLFKKQVVDARDLEFMADTSAAVLASSPKSGRLILWLIVLLLVVVSIWASKAKLEEVTIGGGKIIPSSQVQVVQNLEGGILADILISEGDVVAKDQVILRIDDTRFAASFRESSRRSDSLNAKVIRLKAEAEGQSFNAPKEIEPAFKKLLDRELELYKSRQDEYQARVSMLQKQALQQQQELAELAATENHLEKGYKLMRKELKMTEPLLSEGAVSEVEVLRLQQRLIEMKGELETTKLAKKKVRSRYGEYKYRVDEYVLGFRNEAKKELIEVIAELAGLAESNVTLEDRVQRTAVKSPVHGTVKKLMVNTVGGVIKPGMELVEIVPLEDTLLVEAKIRPADIAFLRPGLTAMVKFSAYDFSIYGGLKAKLEHISADTLEDEVGEHYYLIRVRTQKNYLGNDKNLLPIIPGMMASVEILTGKKTVLHYILKPFLRAKENALRER